MTPDPLFTVSTCWLNRSCWPAACWVDISSFKWTVVLPEEDGGCFRALSCSQLWNLWSICDISSCPVIFSGVDPIVASVWWFIDRSSGWSADLWSVDHFLMCDSVCFIFPSDYLPHFLVFHHCELWLTGSRLLFQACHWPALPVPSLVSLRCLDEMSDSQLTRATVYILLAT